MIDQFNIQTKAGTVNVKASRRGLAPLVLLHGSGFSSAVFHSMFEDPRYGEHDLVAIDFPGCGQSDNAIAPASTYNFGGLSDVVAEVISAMMLKDVTVFGWSLGGHVAIDLLDRCDAVRAAITSGTPPLRANTLSVLHAFHFSRDMLALSKASYSNAQARHIANVALGNAATDTDVGALLRVDTRFRPHISQTTTRGRFSDQRAIACKTKKPLCVIATQDDPFIHAGFMRNFINDNQFMGTGMLLPSGGHAPFLSNPSAFHSILTTFMRNLNGRMPPHIARAA